PIGDLVAQCREPIQDRNLKNILGDTCGAHVAASTSFSASRMRISPETSFGSRASRIAARVRDWHSLVHIPSRIGLASRSKLSAIGAGGISTSDSPNRSGRTAGYALPSAL